MSLLFKIEIWTADQNTVEEVLGELSSYTLAKAAFEAAVAQYPRQPITVRHGARVIAKSKHFR